MWWKVVLVQFNYLNTERKGEKIRKREIERRKLYRERLDLIYVNVNASESTFRNVRILTNELSGGHHD